MTESEKEFVTGLDQQQFALYLVIKFEEQSKRIKQLLGDK